LAAGAVVAGALADGCLADGGGAMGAGCAGPPIDLEPLGEVAGTAVLSLEVAKGGAALFDGGAEDRLDLLGQTPVTREGDAAGRAPGMDAGGEQGLAGVDIADADHRAGVHDEILDRGAAALGAVMQPGAVEVVCQWFRPQRGE